MKPLLPLLLLFTTPALAGEPAPAPAIAGTRLSISATGTVTRAPDVATLSTGVVTEARSAAAAMADNAARMATIVAALRRAGIEARDLQTSAVTLGPHYRSATDQSPVLTGYQATNRVAVRVREVARVGEVLDALAAAGATEIDGPDFALDQPDPALNEARVKALASARARAELYATAAGLRVRRIVSIEEADGGMAIARPMALMAARAKSATPIESGEQTVSVTLAVAFELQ